MKAAAGDRMVVAAKQVDGAVRDGRILRTGPDGEAPYVVRWEDSGHESVFYPGPGAHVEPAAGAPGSPSAADATGRGAGRPVRTRHWTVDVYLYEDGRATSAQAVLHGDTPAGLDARGRTTRDPRDADVPEIGDEIAVARALRRLGDRLLATAAHDLAGVEGHPVHLHH